MRPVVGYVVIAATVVIALSAMLWGWKYSVPDLLRISYGLPLSWGVNTLETIAGPVDRWSIDLVSLAVDLFFWFMTLIAAQFIASRQS